MENNHVQPCCTQIKTEKRLHSLFKVNIIIRISIILVFLTTLPTRAMQPRMPNKQECAWLGIGIGAGTFVTAIVAFFWHKRATTEWQIEKIKMESRATEEKNALKFNAKQAKSTTKERRKTTWERLAQQRAREAAKKQSGNFSDFYERLSEFIEQNEAQFAAENGAEHSGPFSASFNDAAVSCQEQPAPVPQKPSTEGRKSPQAQKIAKSWNKKIARDKAQADKEKAERERLEQNKKTASRPPSPVQ